MILLTIIKSLRQRGSGVVKTNDVEYFFFFFLFFFLLLSFFFFRFSSFSLFVVLYCPIKIAFERTEIIPYFLMRVQAGVSFSKVNEVERGVPWRCCSARLTILFVGTIISIEKCVHGVEGRV